MSYVYEEERGWLFTDEGQRAFLKVRDAAHSLLRKAGAFREVELQRESPFCGDTFKFLACVDRLVELGEVVRVRDQCYRQFAVYATSEVSTR